MRQEPQQFDPSLDAINGLMVEQIEARIRQLQAHLSHFLEVDALNRHGFRDAANRAYTVALHQHNERYPTP